MRRVIPAASVQCSGWGSPFVCGRGGGLLSSKTVACNQKLRNRAGFVYVLDILEFCDSHLRTSSRLFHDWRYEEDRCESRLFHERSVARPSKDGSRCHRSGKRVQQRPQQ